MDPCHLDPPQSWRIAHPAVPHDIFHLVGLAILTMKADYMRCKQLGTDQCVLASAIAYLAARVMETTVANNVVHIFYEVNCRLQNLT
eukprot:8196996-Alexandrium_andersonii.AAC.1